MKDTELAQLLVALIPPPGSGKQRNDYMLNINHPVISVLYKQYKAAQMIPAQHAPSDYQRTEFELALLGTGAKQVIAQNLEKEKTADTL